MIYHQEQDGSIRVENYRDGLGEDVTIGHLRQGGEDAGYWHFYPSPDCVLNASGCERLSMKLSELNSSPPKEP
jgi:hypothetical protein